MAHEQAAQSKCPNCGKTMVQNFDYKQGPNNIQLAIPNGKYDCLWCGYSESGEPKP